MYNHRYLWYNSVHVGQKKHNYRSVDEAMQVHSYSYGACHQLYFEHNS